jgi:hypothetical protein
LKAREISESKQWTIEITWKSLRKNLIPIISSIICHIGGIIFILSTVQIGGVIEAFSFGVLVFIGAFVGLKYHRGGSLLCLFVGIISLMTCQVPFLPFLEPCINLSPGFFYGTIFTISGSIVGLIGGIIKKRKQKINQEEGQLKVNLNQGYVKDWIVKSKEISETEFEYFMHFYQKLSIIGSILCYFGGILFFWSIVELQLIVGGWGAWLMVIFYGVMVIIGSIIGLKYQRGGPLLCVIIVLISSLTCQTYFLTLPSNPNSTSPCVTTPSIYLSASIITILGSIVGFIGGMLKARLQERVEN